MMKYLNTKNIFWVYVICATCYMIQGIEALPSLSLFKYFKEVLMYPPEKLMILNAIIGLAWIPKIIWGILIDRFLSKKVWITFSLLIDIATVLFLGIWSLPLVMLITMMFLNSTDSAVRDVSVDGIMCVEGKKFSLTGKIQSVQWISITIASIFTGLAGGYIADHFDYKVGFLLLIPFYLAMFIPLYFYKEDKKTIKKCQNELNYDGLTYCKNTGGLACYKKADYCTKNNFLDIIRPYKSIFKNKSFLWACLFLFLYKFSPSFGTPLSYIERDKFAWSFQFMGILSTIGSVVSILGAIIYFKLSNKIGKMKIKIPIIKFKNE